MERGQQSFSNSETSARAVRVDNTPLQSQIAAGLPRAHSGAPQHGRVGRALQARSARWELAWRVPFQTPRPAPELSGDGHLCPTVAPECPYLDISHMPRSRPRDLPQGLFLPPRLRSLGPGSFSCVGGTQPSGRVQSERWWEAHSVSDSNRAAGRPPASLRTPHCLGKGRPWARRLCPTLPAGLPEGAILDE